MRANWWHRHQSSQALVEFAIIAPLLLIFIFGVVDFGRLIYTYVTLNQAVNEGARVAIRASAPLPSNSDVLTAVRSHASAVNLAYPCPNGPIDPNGTPPENQGIVYITQPDPPTSPQSYSPGLENAPGGEVWANQSGSCSAIGPASGHAPLRITIRFNFVPMTPIIAQLAANHIVVAASVVYSTEY